MPVPTNASQKNTEKNPPSPQDKQLQSELLWQVRSRAAGVAVVALNAVRREGWLDLLSGEKLGAIRWTEANLEEFDLSDADMSNTLLHNAYLRQANMRHTVLVNTNLKGAYLVNADLQGAYMDYANLSGANLRDTNLEGVHFSNTIFDAQTLLPDGMYWTKDTDLTRFTDPKQKAFWRSPKAVSPAYRLIARMS
jgi:uncharacterized protein YjbI with pentapeptide repeats